MYRSKYRCSDCKHEFERTTKAFPKKDPKCPKCNLEKRVTMKNSVNTEKEIILPSTPINEKYKCSKCFCNFGIPQAIGEAQNPFCPKCGSNETGYYGTTAPSLVPQQSKNFNKALDMTAKICMEDQNMTDINIGANLRLGDSCAPKLSHENERKVDEVFKIHKPIMGQTGATNLNKALTSQINSGRYSNQTHIRDVAAQAQSFGQARTAQTGEKVPTREIYTYDNRKPN